MEAEELKRKLMGLWEKTTHNSKEFLSVLFDYYFDEDLIEYKEIEGKVVSAVCGIPYSFGIGRNYLKGLYLISLSSEEGFRKKGILAELLNNINSKKKDEYDFTFIVPHTNLMADYYGTQGYFSSFFILEERFTPLHDFRNDYILSLTDSEERIRELKKGLIDQIKVIYLDREDTELRVSLVEFIKEIENRGTSAVNLLHTAKDLDYILNPQSIRNLSCFVAFDNDERICGVAFTEKNDIKRTKVVAYYVADSCSYFALLDFIKRYFPDNSLSVDTSDPKYQSHSLIQQTYASKNPAGGDLDNTYSDVELPFNINKLLQPLGMVRLLKFENILKYVAETRSDVDFQLYIRDYRNKEEKDNFTDSQDSNIVYVVRNGKLTIENRKTIDRGVLNLTTKEVSELLLRKNDTSNLIMEAFGIPRLNLQMRLLPL